MLAVECTWLPRRIGAGLLAGEEPPSLYGYLEARGLHPDAGEGGDGRLHADLSDG